MAVTITEQTAYLLLTGADVTLDIAADFTVFVQGRNPTALTAGVDYRTLLGIFVGGDTDFSGAFIWLGFYEATGQQVLALHVSTGMADNTVESIVDDQWIAGGVGYTYDAGTSTFTLFVNGVSVGTFVLDMTGLVATDILIGDDFEGDNQAGVLAAAPRQAAAILTGAQLRTEGLSQTPVLMTAIGGSPLDNVGVIGTWTAPGAGYVATADGPLPTPYLQALCCVADSADAFYNPARQFFAFDSSAATRLAAADPPLSITSGISNVSACQRSADAHVFLASGNGWVYEWDRYLARVQQFGGTSSSAPGTLYPTNAPWTLMGIQFTAGYCWLCWVGSGFPIDRHLSVQQRHATTLALVNQYNVSATDLPGSKEVGMVNAAGTIAFTNGTGGSIVDQNVIWSYTIATDTVAAWGSYGTWTPNVGWYVHEFRVAADDRIVATYWYTDGSGVDDSKIVVFAATGALLHEFTPEDSAASPVLHMGLSATGTAVWTAQRYFDADLGDYISTFRAYDLTTGGKGAEFDAPAELAFGWILEFALGVTPPPGPGTTRSIRRVRQFPLPSSDSNKAMFIPELEVLLQTGVGDGDPTSQGYAPVINLSISKDGGKTFGPEQSMSVGKQGEYTQRVRFRRTPNRYRNGVVQIVATDPVDWTLVDVVCPSVKEGSS